MARKACAQSVPQLTINSLNCGCEDAKGRYSRIARNAIMPFYFNCNVKDDEGNCQKVFYIKNPSFYSGTGNSVPSTAVTQVQAYARAAQIPTQNKFGPSRTVFTFAQLPCQVDTSPLIWSETYFKGRLFPTLQSSNPWLKNCGCNSTTTSASKQLRNRMI